jgi:hypothetical protein
MKFKDGIIFAVVFACGVGMASAANACSTASWSDSTGAIAAGSPTAVPRFSQLCALNVTGSGSVRDLTPDHTRIRARFYVLSKLVGSGNVVLFRAYGSENDTVPLFEIRRNGANLQFDTTAAGGASVNFTAPAGWTAIEFDWTSTGNMDIWVNAASTGGTSTTVAAGTGTVKSVRLGLVTGLDTYSGSVVFDAYEAHSTTPVGLLLLGDANGGGTITSTDATRVLNEISVGGTLSTGQPDCNLGGSMSSADATCILGKIPP